MNKPIKFKPRKGTVVIQIISNEKTRSGIFIPGNAAKETDETVLVAAHPSFQEEISIGTRVSMRNNSTFQPLKLDDGSQYFIFEEKDVLGVYE